jgi:hypothetical protein
MQVPDTKAQEMWVEAGSPPEQLSDGNYIMSYNIADGDLWWGIGQCAALRCITLGVALHSLNELECYCTGAVTV